MQTKSQRKETFFLKLEDVKNNDPNMKITENELGLRYEHPSFGMLSFSRTSGGKTNLFGSSIQHRDTIRMRIRQGSLTRGLNEDWYNGTDEIIEVEMSYSQFAECITSMNVGTGTPCTIRWVKGIGPIPEAEFVNRNDQILTEFKENVNTINADAAKIYEEIKTLFETKKSIGKTDREQILQKLGTIVHGLPASSEFIMKQFQRQMEHTVTEAKGEIEAFAQNKINSIAQQALVEHKEEILALKNPVDVNTPEISQQNKEEDNDCDS